MQESTKAFFRERSGKRRQARQKIEQKVKMVPTKDWKANKEMTRDENGGCLVCLACLHTRAET